MPYTCDKGHTYYTQMICYGESCPFCAIAEQREADRIAAERERGADGVTPDLIAYGFNWSSITDEPHWDSIRDDLTDWIKEHPDKRECVIQIPVGETMDSLHVPMRYGRGNHEVMMKAWHPKDQPSGNYIVCDIVDAPCPF